MGHSSLAVSLTYLRGLEVSELEESDMPVIVKKPPEGGLDLVISKESYSL